MSSNDLLEAFTFNADGEPPDTPEPENYPFKTTPIHTLDAIRPHETIATPHTAEQTPQHNDVKICNAVKTSSTPYLTTQHRDDTFNAFKPSTPPRTPKHDDDIFNAFKPSTPQTTPHHTTLAIDYS